jgi:L-Lysine epsilon oxidase N-terminal/L-lysine epsilon oxidase C-terminal domain
MPNLKTVKIFPPIGIARIGNSPEWFLGPELPFPAPPPVPADGKYKDSQCRIRRQAQRFRLWGYFDDGTDRELTAADGTIQWTVHLANAKAVFQGEAGGLIDPGPRTLNGANDSATFANGIYSYSGQTVEVPLGEAQTDQDARLIVIGGFGFSSSPVGNGISEFWNNPGWHDDISDGPVNATITVGANPFAAAGAWVICPPPRYAPSTYSPITLYDSIRQVAITQNFLPQPGQPSFVNDIWPILTRGIGMLRVEATTFSPGDHSSLGTVIPPGPNQDAARAAIFTKLANPGGTDNVGNPNQPYNMPLLNTGFALGSDPADIPPTLRPFQIAQMQSWSQNNFINDWPPVAPVTITPDDLTQAALENCVGGPFFPGIEATVSVNDGSLKYIEAFRFDQTGMNPGDVTQGMARPWQADFYDCTSGGAPDTPAWWPAARPDSVYPDGMATPADWGRGIINSYQDMVDNWFRLGFIVDPGTGLAVETERTVVCKDCFIITERNEIAEEEAQALIIANQPIQDAFYLVIEGFAPNDLGIMSANLNAAQLQALFPSAVTLNPMPTQMTANVNDMLLENNNALNQAQRVTLGYNISFTGTSDFTAPVVPIQLNANIQGVSSTATIDLIQADSPYMDHGPTSWLSNDLRVFKLQPNQPLPNISTTLGNDPIAFIQNVLNELRSVQTPAQAFNTFENLPTTGPMSELEWLPQVNNQPVYNFALCRVRYRATSTPASNVRVFFRLFQTAATGTDYNPNTTYRSGGHPGVKIAKLGIQGGELVTIPFFAEARKAANVNLNQQSDSNNVQPIQPAAHGAESYMYYGCWLDINQPLDLRFPIQPSPPDGGPFTGQLQSIANLIRGTHQCLVAEISYDLVPITPIGISTANSDQLSQRNLVIDDSSNPGNVDTRRVQHTFTVHPTQKLTAKQRSDELMIDWGNTPSGSVATVYLPAVRASDVLDLAARSFNLQTLERVDDHTIRCKTAGVTYIPIPPGDALDLAGLITLELPAGIRKGQTFRIVARQVVDTPTQLPAPPTVNTRGIEAGLAEAPPRKPTRSRHVIGSFQFSVLVKTEHEMLPVDERTLTALKRVIATVPLENRWYPVLQRYLSQVDHRIISLGGKPGPGHHPPGEERVCYEGKVSGLRFDRFGDFEGFSLDTEDGERTFRSREKEVEKLVREAWAGRIPILVIVEKDNRKEPQSIVLLRPPADL